MSDQVRDPEDRFSHNEAHICKDIMIFMNVYISTLAYQVCSDNFITLPETVNTI